MGRRVVVWRVTERCNLACGFCAFDRTLPFARREVALDDVVRFVDLLGELRSRDGREVLISWLGGEPFLWPHLELATIRARNAGLQTSLTTNGLALASPRWLEFARTQLDELTISVDGTADLHDALRGQPGHHERLLEATRALRGGRAAIKVNTVLMADNIEAFEEMALELADAGVGALTFNALGGRDRPEFHAQHKLSLEQIDAFAEALPRVRARAAERGMAILGGSAYLARLRASALGEKLAVDDCGPGEHFCFIDAEGFVAPCSFSTDGVGVPLDTLRSVDDLLVLPKTFARRRDQARLAVCRDCPSTQVFSKFTREVPA
ncbi:MAG: radical SAM protein [Deltaproteobacteria bacterium]|nr:radical SAM protein [Deltaproteobacteria bacterium]